MRLTMKPGVSDANTGTFFQARKSSVHLATTSEDVRDHGTTSTSGITGGGLKKCRPTTRSEVLHAPAIAVTDSDDVLVASTASAATTDSSEWNRRRFAAKSSTMASI